MYRLEWACQRLKYLHGRLMTSIVDQLQRYNTDNYLRSRSPLITTRSVVVPRNQYTEHSSSINNALFSQNYLSSGHKSPAMLEPAGYVISVIIGQAALLLLAQEDVLSQMSITLTSSIQTSTPPARGDQSQESMNFRTDDKAYLRPKTLHAARTR